MATKRSKRKAFKGALKKEVHIPFVNKLLPDSKLGKALGKQRKVPLSKLPLAKYFRDSYKELRKVTWPSRRESIKLTISVIVFTAIFTLFITIADAGIGYVVERVIL